MFYRLKSSSKLARFILLTSDYSYCNFNNPNPSHFSLSRSSSILGSTSYLRSLRRSFSYSKLLSFFNPDLNTFITLTYKSNQTSVSQVLYDIKQLIKKTKYNKKITINKKIQNSILRKNTKSDDLSIRGIYQNNSVHGLCTFPQACIKNPNVLVPITTKKNSKTSSRSACGNVHKPTRIPTVEEESNLESLANNDIKYIFVLERQKRGSIHVHMISSPGFITTLNKNNYLSIKYWKHGFSTVATLADFDTNFKPYLYLFKYMYKSERIGKSFIHTSRGFDKINTLDYADYIQTLDKENLLFKEDYNFLIDEKPCTLSKEYFKIKEMEN